MLGVIRDRFEQGGTATASSATVSILKSLEGGGGCNPRLAHRTYEPCRNNAPDQAFTKTSLASVLLHLLCVSES